jgi:uncharacterized protein (UPF0248 family)
MATAIMANIESKTEDEDEDKLWVPTRLIEDFKNMSNGFHQAISNYFKRVRVDTNSKVTSIEGIIPALDFTDPKVVRKVFHDESIAFARMSAVYNKRFHVKCATFSDIVKVFPDIECKKRKTLSGFDEVIPEYRVLELM